MAQGGSAAPVDSASSLPRGSADPPVRGSGPAARVAVPEGRVADLAHGREVYSQTCIVCHGENGQGSVHGAVLTPTLTIADIMNTVTNGRNDMPAFGRAYRPEELHDVATFIHESCW